MGTSTCPYSRISFARGLRVVKEFYANLGAAVDIASRSSGIVFRIVTLRVAESVKRTVQMYQSFTKMHIALPVQWQLRSRRQLAYMFQNDMPRTVSCKLQVYIEIGQCNLGQCETLVVFINNACSV